MTRELSWSELTKLPLEAPLVCGCCGRKGRFETPEDAHRVGWDVEPYFGVAPVCDCCLSGLYLRGTCRHDRPRTSP